MTDTPSTSGSRSIRDFFTLRGFGSGWQGREAPITLGTFVGSRIRELTPGYGPVIAARNTINNVRSGDGLIGGAVSSIRNMFNRDGNASPSQIANLNAHESAGIAAIRNRMQFGPQGQGATTPAPGVAGGSLTNAHQVGQSVNLQDGNYTVIRNSAGQVVGYQNASGQVVNAAGKPVGGGGQAHGPNYGMSGGWSQGTHIAQQGQTARNIHEGSGPLRGISASPNSRQSGTDSAGNTLLF